MPIRTISPDDARGFASKCVHIGIYKDSDFNSVTTPIYPSSTFFFKGPRETTGYDYSRTKNPTRSALEENIAALEGGAAASATATGMAATATALLLLKSGDHVVTGNDIYGGTYRLFADVMPQLGIDIEFIDMSSPANVKAALRPNTRAVWIETPSNPLLNLVDIAGVCEVAAAAKVMSMVDNTFMTPYFQRPFELGADLVVHSTTKYINGHSDVVGGAIVSRTAEMGERVAAMVNALGTCCSPFDAFLVLRGLKTLACRMQVHERNANALARFLVERPEVEKVYYPGLEDHPHHDLAKRQMQGFGGMVTFDIKGGEEAAFKFIKGLKLYSFAESLGGVESLIEHPGSMSHASMSEEARARAGITAGCIRVSTGIEDAEDLVNDMRQAFEQL